MSEPTYGASFRRDLDCWVVYEGNGEEELCRCGHDKVGVLLTALRRPPARFTREDVEKAARAMCAARSGNPDCLYQHHEWETWTVDNRHEYKDAFTGEARVTLSHFAWRHWVDAATAALTAIGGVDHG